MFEITPQDIAQLDDKQLRELVGLLCEAELRNLGYHTDAVTYGGDQNAKDGGLDVRVSLPDDKPMSGFIPRRSTGFQVKKQDMPRSAIVIEMCPDGEPRPVIRELAEAAGAYIIISSEGSTSDSALASRKQAMTDAAKDLSDKVSLEFYDRTRMATWVRNHPGLVVWVRSQIGRAIPGWEPFGPWAYPSEGAQADYLFENGVEIRARTAKSDNSLSTKEGLDKIRAILRQPSSVVRLVGLSGVGKTRFAQALFDSRVSTDALEPALVVYTNMNNEPNPQPYAFASDLMAHGMRAILIVDNCSFDLHSRLASLVRQAASCLVTAQPGARTDAPCRVNLIAS